MMVDTFYLHLEFRDKKGGWSINLPFLCTKCGTCCTLEDFLTAGEINAKPEERPEVHAKIKALFEELGMIWKTNEAKYDDYTMHNPCPFLVNRICSIYDIRPDGCKLFPKTAFGMQTQDCEALTRFKTQCAALIKGWASKETYHITGSSQAETAIAKPIKPAKFTKKQYQNCIVKLRQAGMTDDEIALFNLFNEQEQSLV